MARRTETMAPPEPLVFEPDGLILTQFLMTPQGPGKLDIIQGPIGSGKTRAAIMRMVRHASEQPLTRSKKRKSRWAVVRQTFPELKTTTINAFLELFPEGTEAQGGCAGRRRSPTISGTATSKPTSSSWRWRRSTTSRSCARSN
jgi:hypothetical protein